MGFFSEDTLTYTKFRSLSLAEAQVWDQGSGIRNGGYTGSGTLRQPWAQMSSSSSGNVPRLLEHSESRTLTVSSVGPFPLNPSQVDS